MQEEKNKIYISTIVIFWIIFAAFIPTIILLSIQSPQGQSTSNLFNSFWGFVGLPLFFLSFILGIILIILAAKAHFTKISKALFILVGSSAVGIAISAIQPAPGQGYYPGRIGAIAEWVFFILAQYVCPIALLVGAIGIIVLIARKNVIA